MSSPMSRTADGRCVLVLSGEVDLSVAPELVTELEYAVTQVSPRVVLDVAAVEFIDSSGLSALITAHRRAEALGGGIVLRGPTAHLDDLLRLTQLDRVLRVEEAGAPAADVPRLDPSGSGPASGQG